MKTKLGVFLGSLACIDFYQVVAYVMLRYSSLPEPRRSTLSEWLIQFPYEIDQKENLIGMVLLSNLLYKFTVLYFLKVLFDCFRRFRIGLNIGHCWCIYQQVGLGHMYRQPEFTLWSQHECKIIMVSHRHFTV